MKTEKKARIRVFLIKYPTHLPNNWITLGIVPSLSPPMWIHSPQEKVSLYILMVLSIQHLTQRLLKPEEQVRTGRTHRISRLGRINGYVGRLGHPKAMSYS